MYILHIFGKAVCRLQKIRGSICGDLERDIYLKASFTYTHERNKGNLETLKVAGSLAKQVLIMDLELNVFKVKVPKQFVLDPPLNSLKCSDTHRKNTGKCTN
jgi:hypothetical protein